MYAAVPDITPTDQNRHGHIGVFNKKKPLVSGNSTQGHQQQVRLPMESNRVPSVLAQDIFSTTTNFKTPLPTHSQEVPSRSASSIGFHHELPKPEYLDLKRHSLAVTPLPSNMRSISPSPGAKNIKSKKGHFLGKPEIALIPATPMSRSVGEDSKASSSTAQGFFPASLHKISDSSSSQSTATTTGLQDDSRYYQLFKCLIGVEVLSNQLLINSRFDVAIYFLLLFLTRIVILRTNDGSNHGTSDHNQPYANAENGEFAEVDTACYNSSQSQSPKGNQFVNNSAASPDDRRAALEAKLKARFLQENKRLEEKNRLNGELSAEKEQELISQVEELRGMNTRQATSVEESLRALEKKGNETIFLILSMGTRKELSI